MNTKIQLACEERVSEISMSQILPTRVISQSMQKTPKFLCIDSSIREMGLIEPLVVHRQSGNEGTYVLLDGHTRHFILKKMGEKTVKCLIATDDEGFTYNHKVNRLSAIQEHFMIDKAIKNGVSEERIARTLNVDLQLIKKKRDLLNGICKEVVTMLKDKRIAASALRELRKVHPIRQMEIAELMIAVANYSASYMKCLIAGTPPSQWNEAYCTSSTDPNSSNAYSKVVHESQMRVRDLKAIEESHGKNVLHLTIVTAYFRKLIDNARVVRFLSNHNRDILIQFQDLVENTQAELGASA